MYLKVVLFYIIYVLGQGEVLGKSFNYLLCFGPCKKMLYQGGILMFQPCFTSEKITISAKTTATKFALKRNRNLRDRNLQSGYHFEAQVICARIADHLIG